MRFIALYIFFLFVLLVNSGAIAQNAHDAYVLPEPGDSIFSLVDNLPHQIAIGSPGQDRVWDFTSLQSPFVRKLKYRSDGEQGRIKIHKGGASYEYVDRDGSLFLTSILNTDPLQMGQSIDFRCSPDLLEYKNPISYQDATSEYSRFIGYLPWHRVPTQFRLPDADLSDSLRIILEVNRDDAADAWGMLLMQNESFDVVRVRRIEEQTLRIQARDIEGNWEDKTAQFQELLNGILWNSVSYSYLFLTQGLAGPVAEVYTDENDEVEKVIFSADPKMAREISPNQRLRGVYVYPNPTFGDVRFEFFNLPEGKYELSVYNMLGKKLWSVEENILNEQVILADLTFLRRGTYFYSLIDESGKRIVTRRLIIIKA